MRKILATILTIALFQGILSAKEDFYDKPIDMNEVKQCSLSEFCEKYLDDIDIEKFIKEELKSDYHTVSLDECIKVALQNNFDIKIQDHNFLSSKYEYQNALSKFLPMLTTTSYIADYSGQILVGGVLRDTFHETALSVNITVEHDLTQGGRQIFEARAKKFYEKSQRHNLNYTKSETIYLTARYYYEMLLAKLNIEIYLRNLIERNAQLTLAKNLQNSGFGTRFDVIRSMNESADAKIKLLKALNEFRLSQSRLANLMGIDVNTALMPFENDIHPQNLVDEKETLEHLFELAQYHREDLRQYEDLIRVEKEIKKVYITDFFPKPLVEYQEQFQGTLNHSIRPNYIMAGFLTWTPGENLAIGTLTKIKAQKEKIRSRALEYENKLRDIKEALINSYSTSYFNKKQVAVTKDRLDYSLESIKLAMLRFNYGKGILLDVIQAQTQMTQARVEYVSAVIKYNISQLELLFNSGTINDEIIIKNYHP